MSGRAPVAVPVVDLGDRVQHPQVDLRVPYAQVVRADVGRAQEQQPHARHRRGELARRLQTTLASSEAEDGFRNSRILVDYVGTYWTVVMEAEVADLSQFVARSVVKVLAADLKSLTDLGAALKAHKQSVVNRDANRQSRTRLRSALKNIRKALTDGDAAGVGRGDDPGPRRRQRAPRVSRRRWLRRTWSGARPSRH